MLIVFWRSGSSTFLASGAPSSPSAEIINIRTETSPMSEIYRFLHGSYPVETDYQQLHNVPYSGTPFHLTRVGTPAEDAVFNATIEALNPTP